MGGHYMPSGEAAPLSQSRGPGENIHPLMFTYPAGGRDVAVNVYDSDFAAASGLADYVAAASAEAIAAHGAFTVALSGGSLVKALAGLVGRQDVDFSKWCARLRRLACADADAAA
jgi:6-phosphogluconolactonase